MGQLTDQYIRTKSKPFIVEIDSNGKSELDEQDKLETIKDKNQFENENDIETKLQRGQIPEYKITREPLEGEPEYLVMEVQLPKVKSSKTISLDIGEDRILLQTRSNVYFLDIYLSFNMNSDDCGAQFDKATQILTITIPLETSK
ncbi:unnamed protein product [Didymodactylos carnosus]|uniref:PIH1D1/2/3 CS-like domain-containing protein n=2 Tax=Didymodactylos carnosus TaxID=1234261 RepID=A0A814KQR4_9BILA|nr:unnamed protein product [Didymodactylos carnosus]CAF3823995.1 unnamed protein product [Didymodactylos carnosus]